MGARPCPSFADLSRPFVDDRTPNVNCRLGGMHTSSSEPAIRNKYRRSVESLLVRAGSKLALPRAKFRSYRTSGRALGEPCIEAPSLRTRAGPWLRIGRGRASAH